MYTQFFKLQEKPFNLSPKASIFHDNNGISTTYEALLTGIQSGEKLILLTGETGTGKTLCAQKLLMELEHDPSYCGITIPFTSLPFDDMLGHICAELNLTFGLGQNNDKLEILEMFLTRGASPIRSIIIVIDEAQNLATEIFSELVNLTKIAKGTKRRIQIVVLVRNETDLKLNQPQMMDFNQNISVRCQLNPLNAEETLSYIRYQLEAAGAVYSGFFTEEAAARVHILTQGHARPINILCDHALNVAANEKETIVTADHVNSAYRQQQFDDTIEMSTAQVSEAISRFADEYTLEKINKNTELTPPASQLPETKFADIDIEETFDPVITEATLAKHSTDSSTGETEKPALIISDEEIQDMFDATENKISSYPPAQGSGRGFWKIALGSIVVLLFAGLLYYQTQQQKIISNLEQQITDNTKNVVPPTLEKNILPQKENSIEALSNEKQPDLAIADQGKGTNAAPVLANPNQADVTLENFTKENQQMEQNNTENLMATTSDQAILPDQTFEETTTSLAISQLLNLAEFQISKLMLTSPKGDNALESYRQILEIDLENIQAREGLIHIKEMFITWAKNNIANNKPDRARQYYEKALLINPDDLRVAQELAALDQQTTDLSSSEITSGLLELARNGNSEDMRILLEKGAYADIQDQKGNSPLMLATDRGHLEVVLTLLSHNANPNLKNKAGDTALINAVWNNQVEIVEHLIRNKVDINAANNRGWTSLMYAAIHGHTTLFETLLENGADPEFRTEDQKTPLSVAAHNGQREIVSLLLQDGAEVNIKDKDGWTPLMRAAWNNHATVVQVLLMNNSHINNRNTDGWTPLMLAAWNGYAPIVRMLLTHGANKSITNNDSERAIDLASEQQHDSVITLLR